MRIAFVAVKGIPVGGGIEKLTYEIGTRLARNGHHPIVYSSRNYGTRSGFLEGMEIRTVPSLNRRTLHKMSICLWATLDLMMKKDADIVHFHAVGPSLFSIFPRLIGIPTVVQTHGLEWKRDKWGPVGKSFFRLADYTAVYLPNAVTSVSMVQKRYYECKFHRSVVHIPSGVSPVAPRPPQWLLRRGLEPNRYILFAARLVEEKGVHFLVEAFRTIDTDVKLAIAGDAAHAEKYKALLRRKAGGDERIVFLGFVTGTALEELFSNAYVFCLPSTLEGLPIALLEAMSYGNCCIASDIAENKEALADRGYYFKNRDVQDLQRTLRYLLDRPDRVSETKRSARSFVMRRYNWDQVANRLEDLYRSILKRDPVSTG